MCAFIAAGSGFATLGQNRNRLAPSTSPRRRPRNTPVRCALDQNTILAVTSALLGIGGGIGMMSFTENQGERGNARGQTMPCVECLGTGVVECTVCEGTGMNPLGAGVCTNCDGVGTVTCLNCGGTGIQPRYLDRLSPEDFMD